MRRRRYERTVAIITDIQANLPALGAALTRIEELGIERIYCGGDLVGYGPHSNEVCALKGAGPEPTAPGARDDPGYPCPVSAAPETLRTILVEHVDRTGRAGTDSVFGKIATAPFQPTTIGRRARKAWAAAAVGSFLRGEYGNLEPVGLHHGRHAHDSFLDAAGISSSRADRYMGHAGRTIGDRRYRHLLRGQLASDARLLDDYLNGTAAQVVPLRPAGAHTGAQREPARLSQEAAVS